AAAIGLPAEPRTLEGWAARTAPWRSYLTAHLWRAVPPRQPARRVAASRTSPSPAATTGGVS
ncbi:DNA-3-methyladenine glycosylase, partial [Microbacterium arthrosphaerae]